jgi:hypothetical protein
LAGLLLADGQDVPGQEVALVQLERFKRPLGAGGEVVLADVGEGGFESLP